MTKGASAAEIPLIRLAHPLAFAAFLQEVGTTTDHLFRRVGLPVYCDDPSAFVPLQQAWALFKAAAQIEDPALGWHVGRFFGDNGLSAGLLKKIEQAPTLYQALKRLTQLVSAEASHLELGIFERRTDILFYTQYSTLKDSPGYTTSQSYQLEVYVDLIRHYAGPDWVPREVGIESPTVPRVAEEHFPGSRFRPGLQAGYVAVPRSLLYMPARAPGTDSADQTDVTLCRDRNFTDTLKALIKTYMTDGYPSSQKMAKLMGVAVRTLHRRLSKAGLTYQEIVDDVRFESACDLLQNTNLQIGSVSRSVGFDDPSHFSRMFRRVGGLNPVEFRASLGA
jgi:AraC-like DNA-binding protein